MDRQDIDALLIGALYGELTPADEARLAAHLESHPADKSALDDLKVAREQVKLSRIFELQTEPPQAISAVLLQEAARRAPKKVVADSGEHTSWFQRFVRSFASHPAMAAAAMLVLVVGIAGTLYMRNGKMGVEQTVDQSEVAPSGNVAAMVPATPPVADPSAAKDQAAAGSAAAYQVALAEDDRKQAEGQQELEKAERAKLAQAPATQPTTTAVAKADEPSPPKKPAAHASKKGTGYLEVETPGPAPKEMPDTYGNDDKIADGEIGGQKQAGPSQGKFATAPAGNAAPGAASTGAAGGGAPAQQAAPPPQIAAAPAAPPPPPADYSKNKTAAVKSPAPSKTIAKPAPPQQDAPVEATRGDTDLIAWAKTQHAAAVAQVKAGNCSAAANLAVSVRSRAYGYYQQNMANDRELKGCASYIADAVNRDEERTSKPKAAKRAADEAPAATSK